MKKSFFILILCLWLPIMSCGSAVSSQDKSIKPGNVNSNNEVSDDTCKVIFVNGLLDFGYEAEALRRHILQDDYYESTTDEQLYAFTINLKSYHDGTSDYPKDYPEISDYETLGEFYDELKNYHAQTAVRLARSADLLVLSDYPYAFYNQPELVSKYSNADNSDINKLAVGDCVVAGTLEQIKELFDNDESMEGWFCIIEPAPRPDILKILKEAGLKETDYYTTASGWYQGNIESVKPLLGNENQVIMSVEVE